MREGMGLRPARSGIFSGMKTACPSPEQVTADFGQEFLAALVHAVSQSGRDLGTLRLEHPDWAVTYSQRFYANFLHERIWGLMLPTLERNGRIQLVDREPRRELTLGAKYRGRFKKHDEADGLHSYRTHSAVEFWHPDEPLPTDDVALYPLAFGYRWDRELNHVEYPVVSLRETMDKAIWVERLDLEADGDASRVVHSPVEPDLPGLEVAIAEDTRERAQ